MATTQPFLYNNDDTGLPYTQKPLFGEFPERDSVKNTEPPDSESSTYKPPTKALPPLMERLKGVFRLLQQWEGRVVNINEQKKQFTAIISDRTNKEYPDEEVDLSIDEIPPHDVNLLKKGAVFYWSIGFADYPGRPRERVSRIRFRRLAAWTDSELIRAREKGVSLARLFSAD